MPAIIPQLRVWLVRGTIDDYLSAVEILFKSLPPEENILSSVFPELLSSVTTPSDENHIICQLPHVSAINLHIQGRGGDVMSNSGNEHSNSIGFRHLLTLRRPLGSRPALQVSNHGLFSSVKLTSAAPIVSILALLKINEDDVMLCFASRCDVVAVDVDVDVDMDVNIDPSQVKAWSEKIPIRAQHVYPWIHAKDIMT